MTYALIGCGRIAINHIKAALHNELDIVAVCDLEKDNMESLLKAFGLEAKPGIRKYQDYHKLIEENELDFVAIATESGSHASIALDCIRKGIHVVIEKPIAMSMEDADAIVQAARENQVKVCACHQNRFNLAVQKLRQAVEKGRFGKISHGTVHVRWNRDQQYYNQAPWRGRWESDGGALMNQCIHGIDLLRWMMNDEVEEVYGLTRQRFHYYLEAEDIGLALLKFKNGAIATIEGTTNVYPRNLEETLYLFGENGTVKLGGKSTNSIEVWEFRDDIQSDKEICGLSEAVNNVYGNGHIALYKDVIEAIRENRQPYIDAISGRNALETVLAIYKSQKTGQPVKLPLNSFASRDMCGMFM